MTRPAAGRACLLPALILIALASAGPAAGATPGADREARRAFQSAEAHFRAGRFVEALADYQAGYDAAPLPGFLINIAQCQRRLGDLTKARATYQKFVLVAPDSPLVPEVQRLMAELDQLLVDLDENATGAGGEAGARSEVSPGSSPIPAAISPPAPIAAISVAPAVSVEPRAPARRRWWLWGIVGAAVVGGAVAGLALSSPGTTTIHDGSLGTLRR